MKRNFYHNKYSRTVSITLTKTLVLKLVEFDSIFYCINKGFCHRSRQCFAVKLTGKETFTVINTVELFLLEH